MTSYEKNKLLVNALIDSAKNGDEEQVQRAIDRDPKTLSIRDQNGRTLLHYTAEHQTTQCAELLITRKPDLLTSRDVDGYTPLHLTAICGNAPQLRFLIKKASELLEGSSFKDFLDACDNEQHTAVHWATVCGEIECLTILHDAGASATVPDIHGAHPIHYASQSHFGSAKDVGLRILKELLIVAPDERDCKDKDGRTPLLWAASSGELRPPITTRFNQNVRCSQFGRDLDAGQLQSGRDSARQGRLNRCVRANCVSGHLMARIDFICAALHCAASRGFVHCLETLITLCGAEIDQVKSLSSIITELTSEHVDGLKWLFGIVLRSHTWSRRLYAVLTPERHRTKSSGPERSNGSALRCRQRSARDN